jgi:vancomycin resistance protein VanJ
LIIGGDFNSVPESAVHTGFARKFQDSWEKCGEGEGFTFPADTPVRRIDYLYSRGLRCTDARVVDTQASDHRPLLVHFEIAPASTER